MAADPGNYPVPSNSAKAFGYPFPTVSDRVGLASGIWIVMLQ